MHATEAPSADLTEAEVLFACRPLRQKAAMVRYLRNVLRLHVDLTPDGFPLVNRAHYNAVRGRLPPAGSQAQNDSAQHQPAANLVGLQAWAAKRRGQRGKAA